MKQLKSSRLDLIASTLEHIRAELETPDQLAFLLDAVVSSNWPTGEYDRDAMQFFRSRFEEEGEAAAEGWYGWYAIRNSDSEGPRTLVGAGGYFGPADLVGTVEIGYSILPQWQRRGYATELAKLLLENAFSFLHVQRVIAQTTESNQASVAVLRACGFVAAGPGREIETLRFEASRPGRSNLSREIDDQPVQ